MADLSLDPKYRTLFYEDPHPYNTPFKSRKKGNKIMPNYDGVKGLNKNYVFRSQDHFDAPYSQYKVMMLDKVKELEQTTYRGMIVNRGGHPKTNTTETRYKHLRRMIKDGYLKMEKRRIYGYRTVSVLVTT